MASSNAKQHPQKVHLAGGNQVSQAVKPSKAKITLGNTPETPTFEKMEAMAKRLEDLHNQLFRTQLEKERAREEIKSLTGEIARLKRLCQENGLAA